MIDLIVLAIILFFISVGWRKGFRMYLLELVVIAVSFLAGWYYYQQSQQVLKSIMVCVVVFAGLTFFRLVLTVIGKKEAAGQAASSITNRFAGSVLGLLWGTLMAAALLLLFTLLPAQTLAGYSLEKALETSRAFSLLQRLELSKNIPILESINYLRKASLDEEEKARLADQPQFQELLQNENMKAIIDDPQTQDQLNNKDIKGLLTNPKIRNLLNDGQFVEKLLKLKLSQPKEK